MNVALIGCGYVADFYARTLSAHPELELVHVADRNAERAAAFADHYGYRVSTVADILADRRVDLVANLTSTASHFDVTRAALEAGKHVYSEKPLAMDFAQAEFLAHLAAARGLVLATAPSNVLGESAQTLWKALRAGVIGTPRLVYATLDDGPIHRMDYREWRSASGAPWPWQDEFETGCALEHAGYYLSWLTCFFGAAHRITTFATTLVPDKAPDAPSTAKTADFSVACLEYPSGMVARLTCSILAPRDHSITVVGDEGTLTVADCWDDGSPVRRVPNSPTPVRREWMRPWRASRDPGIVPLVRAPSPLLASARGNRMDFARGLAEVASAITEGRSCRLGGNYALHVAELTLAMQYPAQMGSPRVLQSHCEPGVPMPWATD